VRGATRIKDWEFKRRSVRWAISTALAHWASISAPETTVKLKNML
jgi:hypothetical protein